jgi:hypothetical protein
MRLQGNFLILGVTAGLALAVTLVVANVGARAPADGIAQTPLATADTGEGQGAAEHTRMSAADASEVARTRSVSASEGEDLPPLDAERRSAGRKREAECLAEFLALRTEQGPEALERTVREVLASSSEPQVRKVAALRALHAAELPATVTLLAAAVEGQPDVSDGSTLSVPRAALKLLFERAPSGEDARRVLARLAFVQEARLSPDLRHQASTALAGSIRGPRYAEVERLLRLETAPAQLDAALRALSQDTNFGAPK